MTDSEIMSRLIVMGEIMARRPLDASVMLPDFAALLADLRAQSDAPGSVLSCVETMMASALLALATLPATQLQTQRLLIVIGQAIELVRDRLEIAARKASITLAGAA